MFDVAKQQKEIFVGLLVRISKILQWIKLSDEIQAAQEEGEQWILSSIFGPGKAL